MQPQSLDLHGHFESLTDCFQRDRLYWSLSISSTFSRCGRIVSHNRVQVGIPAYQVFRKFVNHFPRCRVTRRHDPRLCIECPYHLFSISLNPMTPDAIILFKLLVQLQGFTVVKACEYQPQYISPQSIRSSPLAVSPSLHYDGYRGTCRFYHLTI